MRFALLVALSACSVQANVQCEQNANCDLNGGGVCLANGDHQWCAYPDAACESGFRFSDFSVGDGVSGQCVPATQDAGVDAPDDGGTDAPTIDAAIPPEMVLVPSGTFMMGCNAAIEGTAFCADSAQADETPYHQVSLSAFLIDKLEVSRAKYNECAIGGVCAPTGGDMTSNLPVAVSWERAATYCAFVGKRLPTEAEWEMAARGTDGRTFPWGSTPPNCTLTQYMACGGGYITVDSLPAGASPFGALNMSGNISEWVRDFYDGAYYSTSPGSNPSGPTTGDSKSLRGGNGISPVDEVRVANRAYKLLANQSLFGVRCAKDY